MRLAQHASGTATPRQPHAAFSKRDDVPGPRNAVSELWTRLHASLQSYHARHATPDARSSIALPKTPHNFRECFAARRFEVSSGPLNDVTTMDTWLASFLSAHINPTCRPAAAAPQPTLSHLGEDLAKVSSEKKF